MTAVSTHPRVPPATASVVLDRGQWTELEARHSARATDLTREHVERAARGEKHPVWDFLFTYYSYRPSRLRRWHPGPGVGLCDAPERSSWRWYRLADESSATVQVDADRARVEKPALLGLIERILRRTAAAPGEFSCFGLHEWAMVYRAGDTRHPQPLRLGAAGTDEVVASHDLRCTHFDAFRFFTPEAVPRNRQPLRRDEQSTTEQPGCLHAGMDVYKWAVKLGPLVPGHLLLDAFELARDIRRLDMEASPYDLADWGFAPVRIEEAAGKVEYVRRQREFAARSTALRRQILQAWLGDNNAT